jgi:hypothetical protein
VTLTQAAKQRACDLANAQGPESLYDPLDVGHPEECSLTALAQLCQDISDAVKAARRSDPDVWDHEPELVALYGFALPNEPDILAEAIKARGWFLGNEACAASDLRAAVNRQGYVLETIKRAVDGVLQQERNQ